LNKFTRPFIETKNEIYKHEKFEFWGSVVASLAGYSADMTTTAIDMGHSQYARYRATCNAVNNGIVTYGDCGQWFYAYYPDSFKEGGWAVTVLGINPRNTLGVVVANGGFELLSLGASSILQKKGGKKLKALAVSINLWRANVGFAAARNNVKAMRMEETIPGATVVEWYNP
jgi:hypothetical protein